MYFVEYRYICVFGTGILLVQKISLCELSLTSACNPGSGPLSSVCPMSGCPVSKVPGSFDSLTKILWCHQGPNGMMDRGAWKCPDTFQSPYQAECQHPQPLLKVGCGRGLGVGSRLPVNLECQSMKGLLSGLNFLDFLSLQPKHSFMSVVPGLVFFLCNFPRGLQRAGARGWVKRQHLGVRRGMSHSLRFSFDLVSDTAYL